MHIIELLKRRKRRFYKSFLLGATVSVVLSVASYVGYLEFIEDKALDFLMFVRGQQRSPEIVLVKIDDKAFETVREKQPLPRSYLANLIDVISRGGAMVIGVDIELRVPSDRAEDERLIQAIHNAQENGSSKVVLSYSIRAEKEGSSATRYRRSAFFDERLNVVAGFANASLDSDGFVRQVPITLQASDGEVLPSLGIAVLARYAGYEPASLDKSLKSDQLTTLLLPESDRLSGKLLPNYTNLRFAPDESWRINFTGGRESFVAIPSDPIAQLAKSNHPLAEDNPFRGKIVLIGATFQESRDFYSTPHGLMSGLEVHANIIHTILARSQIRPTQWLIACFISVFFTLLTSLLIAVFNPTIVTILSLVAIPVVLIPLSYAAFAYLGLWIDFVTPFLAMHWGALAAEHLESRHVRKSLGQYLGWEVAKQIVEQDEQLAGRRLEVTVLFTDVRNFTTLCEGLPPEAVVARMNQLFAMMGKIIASHGGTIIDFIGDAVFAVFGAPKENPEHRRAAVETGIEILAGLDELNARWEKSGIAPLRIGVGIHTGDVVAGISGAGERKKFDITGDTVNTGARVEGLNKQFGTQILATRETIEKLVGQFTWRNCGLVSVKGRERPVEVFEIERTALERDIEEGRDDRESTG
jgi:adenylate cyclase